MHSVLAKVVGAPHSQHSFLRVQAHMESPFLQHC